MLHSRSSILPLALLSALLGGAILPAQPLRDRGYAATYYDADLRPSLSEGTIEGTVKITIESLSDTLTRIVLDAGGMTFTAADIDGHPASLIHTDTTVAITLDTPLHAGRVMTLMLRYQARPTRGVTFLPDQIFTQFHTHHWLPCDDDPASKAALRLRLTLPAGMTAIGNGREVEERKGAEGTVSVWQLDHPHSSYLFGFAAGRFGDTSITVEGMTLRYLGTGRSPAELARIFASTPHALRYFRKRAGIDLPWKSYGQALVDGNAQQELAGFTLLGKRYGDALLLDSTEDWLIAHELAHQWWGNLLTCRSWSEIWLNEGMATYMEAAFKEEHWGTEEYDREMELARLRYDRAREAGNDRALFFTRWKTPEEANGMLGYYKGALVLGLLRYQIGDDAFWNGIARYTREHAGGAVTGDDLRRAMEKACGADLARFFSQWVVSGSVPTIVARHRVEGDDVVVEIEQRGDSLWHLPLQIAVGSSRGRESRRIELTERVTTVRFPLDGSLLSVRVDDGGHLPIRIGHERPLTMLLHQAASEPDQAGRIDALLAIGRLCDDAGMPDRQRALKAVEQIAAHDPQRLVRQVATDIARSHR